MEFKGTKGDYYTTYVKGVGTVVYVNNYGNIKKICNLNQNNHEDAYNAKLISKSPEMLEMLKDIYSKYEKDGHLLNVSPTKVLELIKSATEI